MKRNLAIATTLATLALPLALPASALASPNCSNTGSTISVAEASAKVEALGYSVRKVEMDDDGCYEVYGMKDGQRHEVYLHPSTGAVVAVELDD